MSTSQLVDEPIPTPRFEELVRELDELLLRETEAEAQPAIEELFLARMADARPALRRRVGRRPPRQRLSPR